MVQVLYLYRFSVRSGSAGSTPGVGGAVVQDSVRSGGAAFVSCVGSEDSVSGVGSLSGAGGAGLYLVQVLHLVQEMQVLYLVQSVCVPLNSWLVFCPINGLFSL